MFSIIFRHTEEHVGVGATQPVELLAAALLIGVEFLAVGRAFLFAITSGEADHSGRAV
jgi:hypothetical protein